MNTDNAFLGCITHNGQLDYRMAKSFFVTAAKDRSVMFKCHQTSLLAGGCNTLWCDALNNMAQAGLKWFSLLHADIVPEDWWLDKLIAIAEENDADMLSAIVPIKGPEGVTSTAISSHDAFRRYTRLTMKQVNDPAMSATFDIDQLKNLPPFAKAFRPEYNENGNPYLLVNTGCFVCRLDREWVQREDVMFTINDRIRQGIGGNYLAYQEPEDWYFSRMVAKVGGKVMATREVKVEHIGAISYKSNTVWGQETDPAQLNIY